MSEDLISRYCAEITEKTSNYILGFVLNFMSLLKYDRRLDFNLI